MSARYFPDNSAMIYLFTIFSIPVVIDAHDGAAQHVQY